MGLTCYCPEDYDIEAGMWYWIDPRLAPMPFRYRRKKCCSCAGLINTGELAREFSRYEILDEDSVAYRIHGEERKIASWYECEECSELRDALEELGYCVQLGDYMGELVREYNAMRKENR